MEKKTFVGIKNGERVFISWSLKNGEFTASGEYWNVAGTDTSSCGQNLDQILKDFPDNEQVQRIHKVWERWHLNHMRAGSPRQMEAIRNGIEARFNEYSQRISNHNAAYHKARRNLTEQIDKSKWNQTYSTERYFESVLASISDKQMEAPEITRFTRFLAQDHQAVVSAFYCHGARAVQLSKKVVEVLKYGIQKPADWYSFVQQALSEQGLLQDSEYKVKKRIRVYRGVTKDKDVYQEVEVAYQYGSAWIKEELPQGVIDEINSWEEKTDEEPTLIQKLVAKYVSSVVKVGYKDERDSYTVTLTSGATFPFSAGSKADASKETMLGSILSDAEYGQEGFEATLETCMTDFGYTDVKEAIRVAKALVKSYEEVSECGLWEDYQNGLSQAESE